MSDVTLQHMTNGQNISVANTNFDKIQDNINNHSLQKDGGNNVLFQDLDLNGHSILNLASSSNPNSPVPRSDLTNETNARISEDALLQDQIDSITSVGGSFLQAGSGAVVRTWTDKVRERVSPEDFGAKGDGVTDDSLSIQKALQASKVVQGTSGKVYAVKSQIILGDQQQFLLNGCTVKAIPGFTGSSVFLIKEGDGSLPAWYTRVVGRGTVDANFLANSCVEYYYARECDLDQVTLTQPLLYGVLAGSNSTNNSTGINIDRCEVWWHQSYSPITGHLVNDPSSVGVYHRFCTDSYIRNSYSVGYRTGFRSDGSSNDYYACHAWGRQAHGPLVSCFSVFSSSCTYTICYGDTPHNWFWNGSAYAQDLSITEVYGFNIQGFSQALFGCRTLLNTASAPSLGATDNLVVAVNMGASLTPGGLGNIIGLQIFGGSSAYRYKKHFGGSKTNAVILGTNSNSNSSFADNTTRGDVLSNADISSSSTWTKTGNCSYSGSFNLVGIAGNIQGNSGTNRELVYETGTSRRWVIRANTAAESGSNAGSDLAVVTYSDAGSFLQTPMSIIRSSGRIILGDSSATGSVNLSINSLTTTSATAGSASVLPANPTGYLSVVINGATVKIPYYS